ncbi:MAG: SDR family NAD(P)-dependent oxidoreductase [Gemmatimonadaceae bacterium]
MSADFTGRVVVVTGPGKPGQVGEVVARAFADAGAELVLVGRDSDSLAWHVAKLSSLGAVVRAFPCDLSDVASVAALAQDISGVAPNGINALACLAGGFALSGSVADSDPVQFQQQLSVNLTSAYLTTRALLPLIRRGSASIVYFSSVAALAASSAAGMAAYAAAKSGVAALMRAIAAEEFPHGVRANALAPSAIRTATNEQALGSTARYVEREHVADLTLFLCSSAAHSITGQILRLDA